MASKSDASTTKTDGPEVKLYRSTKDTRWFAFDPEIGWVMFPGEVDGWQKRRLCGDTDPIDMCEVPLCMGFKTGIPGAPISPDLSIAPKRKSNRHPSMKRAPGERSP